MPRDVSYKISLVTGPENSDLKLIRCCTCSFVQDPRKWAKQARKAHPVISRFPRRGTGVKDGTNSCEDFSHITWNHLLLRFSSSHCRGIQTFIRNPALNSASFKIQKPIKPLHDVASKSTRNHMNVTFKLLGPFWLPRWKWEPWRSNPWAVFFEIC